jgi:putative radical SAM enzyme (TIGR03279 family)
MRCKHGLEIDHVLENSPAEISGLRSGDILLSINANPLHDVIDFMYHRHTHDSETVTDGIVFEVRKKGSRKRVKVTLNNKNDLGLSLKPFTVKTCKNNCMFCFVKQLPRGLRKSLYLKDEDYRLSFLYGNYMTLANMDIRDKKRIAEKRLSPLYISVHTTNRTVRNRMLGNPRASDIMKDLKFFADNKIRMHMQIVLCPGFNDGQELRNTVKDVYKYYPYTSSIAVVPVGLTKHKKINLAPVEREDAIRTIRIVESFQKRFMKKHGDPFVYCADEMFIKAELPFPKIRNYGSFPQIENGVGMVPLFISQARRIRIPKSMSKKERFLTLTGTSFYPFLNRFIRKLREKENLTLDLIPVENRFFGQTITVTGLLTGRDIITSLHDMGDAYDILIMPEAVLNEDNTLLLDNVSLEDIENAIGLKVVTTDGTPQGLVNLISNC